MIVYHNYAIYIYIYMPVDSWELKPMQSYIHSLMSFLSDFVNFFFKRKFEFIQKQDLELKALQCSSKPRLRPHVFSKTGKVVCSYITRSRNVSSSKTINAWGHCNNITKYNAIIWKVHWAVFRAIINFVWHHLQAF